MKIAFELDMSGRIGVKQSGGRCRCSKIMSPLTATRLCHPLRDGDDESERAATSESDGKCGRRGGERTRSLPPAAFERASGAAGQAALPGRFPLPGGSWE